MTRNIVVLGGNSHPHLNQVICNHLGIAPTNVFLGKFSVGETRVEIKDSVRGKDVFIIQSGCGKVNDNLMELLIIISACKTASAQRVTAVLPLFPYSRQSDIPYNKMGAPLAKSSRADNTHSRSDTNEFTFNSRPQTPHPLHAESAGLVDGTETLIKSLAKAQVDGAPSSPVKSNAASVNSVRKRKETSDSNTSNTSDGPAHRKRNASTSTSNTISQNDDTASVASSAANFQPKPGYKQWVAQAGTLIADLLVCAGADHVITMDLHDPQYQGYFDIPVDNLYGRAMLKNYIQHRIPDYRDAVIVSPDAGGAKRATAIADSLGMPFALIHKERRPARITDRQNATMMLVGDVSGRVAIMIDDLADTSNTITRAARLLKREGATMVYALVTHGVLSGDAIERINASQLDKVVVTNTVPQDEHKAICPKLEVLEVGHVFAEAIRRVHHGESLSALFQYD